MEDSNCSGISDKHLDRVIEHGDILKLAPYIEVPELFYKWLSLTPADCKDIDIDRIS